MIKIVFVPLWLSDYLTKNGLSKAVVASGQEALSSILGAADVKAYSLTQLLMNRLTGTENPLATIVSMGCAGDAEGAVAITPREIVSTIRGEYPEQAMLIGQFDDKTLYNVVDILMGNGIEATSPDHAYCANSLDFQFELIGDTLVVSATPSRDTHFANNRPGARAVIYLNALKEINKLVSWKELVSGSLFKNYLEALAQESASYMRQIA